MNAHHMQDSWPLIQQILMKKQRQHANGTKHGQRIQLTLAFVRNYYETIISRNMAISIVSKDNSKISVVN